jgi:hypothetical protein
MCVILMKYKAKYMMIMREQQYKIIILRIRISTNNHNKSYLLSEVQCNVWKANVDSRDIE